MKILVTVLLVVALSCLLIFLLPYLSSRKQSTANVDYTKRFKRQVKSFSKCTPKNEPNNLTGPDLIRFMYNDDLNDRKVSNMVKNLFSYQISLPLEDESAENHFVFPSNKFPSLQFTIGIPSFSCLKRSSMSVFFKKLEPLVDYWKNAKDSSIAIMNIELKQLPDFIQQVLNIVTLLSEFDPDFISNTKAARSSKECLFKWKCYARIEWSHNSMYTATFHLEPNAKPSLKLSPKAEIFPSAFDYKEIVALDYAEISSAVKSSVSSILKEKDEMFTAQFNKTLITIALNLKGKIKNVMTNIAFTTLLFKHPKHKSRYNNDGSATNLMKKYPETAYNLFNIPNSSTKERIEFLTQYIISVDHFGNRTSDITVQSLNSAISFKRSNNSFIVAKQYILADTAAVAYYPSLLNANLKYRDSRYSPTHDQVAKERKRREEFFFALYGFKDAIDKIVIGKKWIFWDNEINL